MLLAIGLCDPVEAQFDHFGWFNTLLTTSSSHCGEVSHGTLYCSDEGTNPETVPVSSF